MASYTIKVPRGQKAIFPGRLDLGGANPAGERLGMNNYFLERNGQPFFGVSGEFHFSRCAVGRWEDELIKLKMGGINIVSTYIFWIHHEEVAGTFDWEGNKNLRRFIELCGEQGLYAIIRIGPFCHGEVRNGGIPDWLYGRAYEIRSNDPEYLDLVQKWYREISRQVAGLMFQDGGPIIGVQIENEYMHSSAPWEVTTGINQEWLPGGRDGNEHMMKLMELAGEAGMKPPLYTATAWGGASAPETAMLPLWGGYAFWPWIFYGDVQEHPATPEFIFRDYHNNRIRKCYNFEPRYLPEDYPYACCEMGGGMTVFYKYRFQLPPASVSAMSLVKAAGGCNFVGYYMYHGGTNPKGKRTLFLNEHATPKISYDFQAAVGEFGQLREHYHRLRLLHYFYQDFAAVFCATRTILPCDTSEMDPRDTKTLRYAVRATDDTGFLFLNNYQDHLALEAKTDCTVQLELEDETIAVPQSGGMTLPTDVSCILPFNLDLSGAKLKYATTQLITQMVDRGIQYYFCFMAEGMPGEYCFDRQSPADCQVDNGRIDQQGDRTIIRVSNEAMSLIRLRTPAGEQVAICTLVEQQALKLWKTKLWGCERILLTAAALLVSPAGDEARLELPGGGRTVLSVFPAVTGELRIIGGEITSQATNGLFTEYTIEAPVRQLELQVNQVKSNKAVIRVKPEVFNGLKELLLRIEYRGDIGNASIDGELIHDNFSNGAPWWIALSDHREALLEKGMDLYIAPLKQGAYVKSDSMAARTEVAEAEVAVIDSVSAVGVYEIAIRV